MIVADTTNPDTTGIPQSKGIIIPTVIEKLSDVKVYPNPAHNIISLSLLSVLDNSLVDIKVYDLSGRLVQSLYSGNCTIGRSTIKDIDVAGMSNGIYFIVTNVGGNISRQKFIKN